ncbi:conserved hypothetical protein [Altererythrobacter sp. B11]|uniref:DUF4136 domain-containing protein n=1 Tax=Altererythrobacter sp. B11 TaxID=2060312 RepID=UPI000DC6DA56|nr:DUF4136 domain-containing protein [Altererythrobacter sp. B11]BBC70910.1 conserved hypothetical protein [Altererythrobacter sp. B11]
MMMRALLLSLASAPLLAACATAYVSPVEVTRFTGSQPARLGQGTIAVVPEANAPGGGLEFSIVQRAVADRLQALGYRVVPGEGASQVAELGFASFAQQPGGRRSPVSVGVGGSTGSYGSGVGLGVGIDLSGPPPAMIDNSMHVIIRDNATGQALWEGRAGFRAAEKSDYASRQAAAARLASALFQDFPDESGKTVEVTPRD